MRQATGNRVVRRCTAIGVLVSTAVLLAACAPVTAPPLPTPPTAPPPTALKIGSNPLLYPAFDPGISDYVARCGTDPVTVSVEAPKSTKVSVNGAPAKSGRFTKQVQRATGQRFTITVQIGLHHPISSHNVRCLPTDFPTWTSSLAGPTQAEWYLVSSVARSGPGYAAIFDVNGAPVWWGDLAPSLLTTLLPDNTLLDIGLTGPVTHSALDGTHIATVDSATELDGHDALRRPNGNYLVVDNVPVPADFSALEEDPLNPVLPGDANVLDHVFQELTPQGVVVWEWRTSEHIAIAETAPSWHSRVRDEILADEPGDAFHWNAIEEVDDGYILSMRHDDAIYKVAKGADGVDGKMGDILWKLGGTGVPGTSLSLSDDPAAPDVFAGQHDSRWDATTSSLTLYDNGSPDVRSPRSVRYVIDENALTATFQEAVTNPDVPLSNCCGSTRRLAGGNWVTGWGSSSRALTTEQAPDGTAVFTLESTGDVRLYRSLPVPFGQLDRASLVAAMDVRNA